MKYLAVVFVLLSSIAFAKSVPDSEPETSASPSAKPMATPSQAVETNPVETPETQKKDLKIGIEVYEDLSSTINETGTISNPQNGKSLSFGGTETTAPTTAIGVVVTRKSNEWGFLGGIAYEFSRPTTHYDYTINGVETSGDESPQSNITMFVLKGDARYYPKDRLYLLGGLNLNSISVTNTSATFGLGYGLEAGLGYELSDNFEVEAQYRSRAGSMKQSSVISGVQLNEDATYTLSGVVLALRYLF